MTKIKGSNILITGGGSGIGRIMGRVALEKGAKSLTIWDINEQNMADTKAELGAKGLVFTQKVDVSNATQVEEAANIAVTLCKMVDKMMLSYQQKKNDEFVTEGGIRERMTAARLGYRTNQRETIASLTKQVEQLKAENTMLRAILSQNNIEI